MAANNQTVPARKPLPTLKQQGLKSRSPYLRMELLVVNVRNSQGMQIRDLFSRLIRIVFKITSSNFGTYSITLAKMIQRSLQVMELK